jgi:uncharacterized repeat protein (TIGR01451 family)
LITIIGSLVVCAVAMVVVWALVLGGAPAAAETMDACPAELFFSEYIEGSSYNKALEIYNGTGSAITFSGQYTVALYSNGSSSVSQFEALNGSVAAGDVFVIAHASAGAAILAEADQTSSSVVNFNGDDAVALFRDGAIVDVIGQIGTDPGSEWGSGNTSTQDNTLVRQSSVMSGDSDGSDAFDPSVEWDGYAQDTFAHLGGHIIDPCGATLLISKSAPRQVEPGEVFVYTITVRNDSGITPTVTTITDVVPAGTAFITASDGGTELGNVVTWIVAGLADGASVTRTFQVTATAAHGEVIENDSYGVHGGADWATTTMGAPRTTYVVDCGSIYGLQYPGGASLCAGETVEVTGTVYAVYGSDFAMAEAPGAWHGIYVDNSSNTPDVGDIVQVQGDVGENYGFTQISWITHTVLATDTTPYAAEVISTAGAASGESYEGVLVEVQNVVVTDEDLGNGEWEIDDGSGAAVVDDLGYAYTPALDDALDVVRGMLNYSFYEYKIEPRDADDVVPATGSGLLISKDGPAWVPPGEAFTYTLTVKNQTAQLLNGLTVSDTLPLSLTYASSDPSGSWDDATHTISWTETSLAHGGALTYTIVVTAPMALTTVSNTDYATWASNWTTHTVGVPVETQIRDCNTIYGIQYTTDPDGGTYPSLCAYETVTVQGIVYAVYGSGYFIADAAGPWHGIYVYNSNKPTLGDEVQVTGQVREYYGITEIGYISDQTVLSSGNVPYGPSIVTAAQIPYDDPATSEGYESVYVETHDITVTEEADAYGVWTFTDVSGAGGKADDWGYRLEPDVGDEYAILRGALVYDYDEYKVMPRDANDVVQDRTIGLEKNAFTTVAPNSLLTYTLTALNNAGLSLTDVNITDVVPANATFAYALDGGMESGGVVSWTIPTLGVAQTAAVRFVVTATSSTGEVIMNDDYAVSAANFVTPTAGVPIATVVTTEALHIRDIQGAGHLSPFAGRGVQGVHGIVTAKRYEGFYMQDPSPDGDIATSEALFVYTGSSPSVNVGDGVLVDGIVVEFRYGPEHLSMTRIEEPTIAVSSTGNTLPGAIIIGDGGRVPPSEVVDDDANTTFDPASDGIDFYESLEAMLVQVNDAIAVGPTNYGEIAVVGDSGANATLLTPRGGLVTRQNDFNPERILLDDAIVSSEPNVRVGEAFAGVITGVIDYDDYNGNFNLFNVNPLPATTGGVVSETTTAPVMNQLCVASFNVYNLDPGDSAGRFAGLASQIVNNLQAPDIIGLEEIQDNSGEDDDGIVDATETYTTLIAAIEAAGGPTYDFRDIAPEDNQDGGAPGANIRVGFLFRTDRGLSFVDRPGGDASTAVGVTTGATGVELTFSPGRIAPTDEAFEDSRKPLAGEFLFNGHKLFVVANHFNSKDGDGPLFGHVQPPVLSSEIQRNQQAEVVNGFVDSVLALDPGASVIVLGDLNDFQFSEAVSDTLAADVLVNLMSTLPITEQYTYMYNGNSQVLDHILVSDYLYEDALVRFDAVHVNAEFAYSYLKPSDHDPVVATFLIEPDLSVTKDVTPTEEVSPGDVVTYTVTVGNSGDGDALDVVIVDTLPPEVEFGGWIYEGSASVPGPTDDEIVWGPWTVESGAAITYVFTATLKTGSLYYDIPVTNVIEFVSTNAGSGTVEAIFNSAEGTRYIYLPMVTRGYVGIAALR